MKVILTERVNTLGNVGEIVNVSPGYGRNFLLPKGFAVMADESNTKQFENHKRRLAKKVAAEKSAAETLAKRLDNYTIQLTKKVGGSGRLFGTVTNAEISTKLAEGDFDIERRLISIETPIKNLGTFDVKAKLFQGVEATFKVKVVIDPQQEKELKEKEAKKVEAAAKAAARKKEEEARIAAGETEEDSEETVTEEDA